MINFPYFVLKCLKTLKNCLNAFLFVSFLDFSLKQSHDIRRIFLIQLCKQKFIFEIFLNIFPKLKNREKSSHKNDDKKMLGMKKKEEKYFGSKNEENIFLFTFKVLFFSFHIVFMLSINVDFNIGKLWNETFFFIGERKIFQFSLIEMKLRKAVKNWAKFPLNFLTQIFNFILFVFSLYFLHHINNFFHFTLTNYIVFSCFNTS